MRLKRYVVGALATLLAVAVVGALDLATFGKYSVVWIDIHNSRSSPIASADVSVCNRPAKVTQSRDGVQHARVVVECEGSERLTVTFKDQRVIECGSKIYVTPGYRLVTSEVHVSDQGCELRKYRSWLF